MDHIFIHSSADGHPSCVHVLAVVNSASVNKGVPGFPLKASPPQSSLLLGPALQFPAAEDSSQGMSGWAQIVRVTLHSDCHGPTASLSDNLKVFPFDPTYCPPGGNLALHQPPTLWVQGPVSLTLLRFSPSFILPRFAWIYIFLSSGWGLLPVLSWCSERSPVSKDVFLRHLGIRQTAQPPTLPPPVSFCLHILML